tara:strand:- start:1265 stop:1603 length:339 start_codon:yes stop_codon:yes gene_type:complete
MNTRSRSYPTDTIDSVLLGYIAGYSQRNISTITDIPRTTVREWIYDLKKGRIAKPGKIEHAHYWVIEYSVEEVVEGICKICFQTKEFLNRIEDKSPWMTREEREEQGLWKNT